MRTDFSDGAGAPFLSGILPSLRIAIPTWRFVGIQRTPEARREPLSRAEIVALFDSDLQAPRRIASESTVAAAPVSLDPDDAERVIANRIRRALYD